MYSLLQHTIVHRHTHTHVMTSGQWSRHTEESCRISFPMEAQTFRAEHARCPLKPSVLELLLWIGGPCHQHWQQDRALSLYSTTQRLDAVVSLATLAQQIALEGLTSNARG